MAKATNALTQGISGNVSGLQFRRGRDGSIIILNAPRATTKPASAAQQAQRDAFRAASAFGRAVLADPAAKADYAERINEKVGSAYQVAVQDKLTAPEFHAVYLDAYNGRPADVIRIEVSDDFTVTRVRVTIANPDGSVVESGDAVLQPGGLEWRYTATANNASLLGDTFLLEAFDRAGNRATRLQPAA